jgi:hypothetical protein
MLADLTRMNQPDVPTKDVGKKKQVRESMSAIVRTNLLRATSCMPSEYMEKNVYNVVTHIVVKAGKIREVLSIMLSRGSV